MVVPDPIRRTLEAVQLWPWETADFTVSRTSPIQQEIQLFEMGNSTFGWGDPFFQHPHISTSSSCGLGLLGSLISISSTIRIAWYICVHVEKLNFGVYSYRSHLDPHFQHQNTTEVTSNQIGSSGVAGYYIQILYNWP